MAPSIDILKNEPIDIFGWPLFLPVCMARDYYKIWTKERMQTIIDLAQAKNIAIWNRCAMLDSNRSFDKLRMTESLPKCVKSIDTTLSFRA